MSGNSFNLPPGFRFYPTEEELVVHFLQRKASLLPCHPDVIPDLDLYPYDPWELDGKALAEGKQWYYYSRRTQNRMTKNGYWKSIGIDEPVITSGTNKRAGIKKYLVFYIGGDASNSAIKTNWIMEEFRLSSSSSSSSNSASDSACSSRPSKSRGRSKTDHRKWVICKVYERNCGEEDDDGTELSCLDEVFFSLDDLDEISLPIS